MCSARVTLTAVSRAPWAKINAYKKRMGWSFPWVSSYGSDFNFDYHVSFTPDQIAAGQTYYNYGVRPNDVSDEQGISVFCKNEKGEVFRTYSCHGRGIDMVNGAYQYLDLVPKGRDEDGFDFPDGVGPPARSILNRSAAATAAARAAIGPGEA